ncbi:TPA: hypothetical protein DCZ36_01735 [Candidatus Gracilibacteria bacterium]|nr:hypothetical protein [Candidatus Gracilibacteria bacterium]
MQESQYALVRELGKAQYQYPYPTDIIADNDGCYKILQVEENSSGFSAALLQRFSIRRVQKITDAEDGDIQWRILN